MLDASIRKDRKEHLLARMHTNLHSMINSTLINSTLINSTLGEERTLLSRQQKVRTGWWGGTFRILLKKKKAASTHVGTRKV